MVAKVSPAPAEPDENAERLQNAWRFRAANVEANHRRAARDEERAALSAILSLQGLNRRWRARRIVTEALHTKRRSDAAQRLQRAWRRRVWLLALNRELNKRIQARAALAAAMSQHDAHVANERQQLEGHTRGTSPVGSRTRTAVELESPRAAPRSSISSHAPQGRSRAKSSWFGRWWSSQTRGPVRQGPPLGEAVFGNDGCVYVVVLPEGSSLVLDNRQRGSWRAGGLTLLSRFGEREKLRIGDRVTHSAGLLLQSPRRQAMSNTMAMPSSRSMSRSEQATSTTNTTTTPSRSELSTPALTPQRTRVSL